MTRATPRKSAGTTAIVLCASLLMSAAPSRPAIGQKRTHLQPDHTPPLISLRPSTKVALVLAAAIGVAGQNGVSAQQSTPAAKAVPEVSFAASFGRSPIPGGKQCRDGQDDDGNDCEAHRRRRSGFYGDDDSASSRCNRHGPGGAALRAQRAAAPDRAGNHRRATAGDRRHAAGPGSALAAVGRGARSAFGSQGLRARFSQA